MPWHSGSPVASTTLVWPASRAAAIQPGTALSWPVKITALGVRGEMSSRASVRLPPTTHIGTAQQGQCGRAQAGSAIVQHADHSARLGSASFREKS